MCVYVLLFDVFVFVMILRIFCTLVLLLFFFLMIRQPPRSTRTAHSFPTRRSSDLNRLTIPPPSELLLADSDAITPLGLPVPNDSGSLLRRFASPYETRLATDEPMPGTAPMRVPKRLPRIIMPGIFREEDRKSKRLNSSHSCASRMPSIA